MSKEDKEVFLTAYEMNNQWIIDMAADRTPYIDQGASTNLFLTADVHVAELHKLHYTAWEKGMKSLYYCRSTALNRAVVGDGERQEIKMEEDTCLSCS